MISIITFFFCCCALFLAAINAADGCADFLWLPECFFRPSPPAYKYTDITIQQKYIRKPTHLTIINLLSVRILR
jgi:hypothetical protein